MTIRTRLDRLEGQTFASGADDAWRELNALAKHPLEGDELARWLAERAGSSPLRHEEMLAQLA
jgi:hypothetical protein